MSKFFFRAKDWNGKTVKGELDVGSKIEALESIKSGGLVPLTIDEVRENIFTEINNKIFGRIGLKQVATMTRQLSTMMTAGLALTDALSLLKNQAEGSVGMFGILDHALKTVRGGQPLGKALEKYEKVFGSAYIASVKAGEEGGVLEEVLSKLSDNLENENEFQGKVKGAMIYPIIVIIGMIIVAFVMMIFVIPKLMSLYDDFGTAKMPAITLGLMAVSNLMAKLWFLFPLIVFAGYGVLRIGDKSQAFRLKRDTFFLKIPILGELTKKTIMANTSRTLSMLLSAGISLVDCLKIVSNVAGNELYYSAFVRISERVQKGFSISDSFEETGAFPVIVNQMVATGESTGKLDEVLMRVSQYFSMEAEQSVKALTSAIEPLIMIVLGVGVGFLVVAVIMPIYNLTSSF